MRSYIKNPNCDSGFVNDNKEFTFVHKGELRSFKYVKPSILQLFWNTKRLILTSQEKAIALQKEYDQPFVGVTDLRIECFKESEIQLWEMQPVNTRCLLINIEQQASPINNSMEQVIEISIVAMTDTQNRRTIGGQVASFYLSALEAALLTFPEREFIWRPPDEKGSETEFRRQVWNDAAPSVTATTVLSSLNSASFGGEQLAGQLVLVIRLQLSAGIA